MTGVDLKHQTTVIHDQRQIECRRAAQDQVSARKSGSPVVQEIAAHALKVRVIQT